MKRLIVLFIVTVGFLSSTFAQTDQRSRETKIADIVMLLPADNTATFNQLMGELFKLGDVIADLAPRLADPGGNDAHIRYAISGLAMFASKDDSRKPTVEKALCNALPGAKSDEIRDFLLIQLQYVAGNESVKTVTQYLDNARLADAATRVLVRVGNDTAGKVLTEALEKAGMTRLANYGGKMYDISNYSASAQRLTIIRSLGELRYKPAAKIIGALIANNPEYRKEMLYSLAQIADPSSERLLSQVAASVGYKYEPTDALASYILFLKNSLYEESGAGSSLHSPSDLISEGNRAMVTKSAQKMLKATSGTSQLAAKSAALELLTLSAGDKAIGNVTDAMKSANQPYRQAALQYSANIKSAKMVDALLQFAKKEKRAEVKAEIITALGERGDKGAWPYVAENLADDDVMVRAAAIVAAGSLAGVNAIANIVKTMNTGDAQVISAGKNTLLTMAGEQVVTASAEAVLSRNSPQAKVAFLEILSARRAVAQADVIFEQIAATEASVRVAACKALASVVTEKDVPRIARLLDAASDKNEITALQRAFYAAVSTESQERQTDLVVEYGTKSANPGVYGIILAFVGGEKALDLVVNQGFNSGDADVKGIAFEALLNWSDGLAIPQLYKIAVGDPSGAYFDKALTAYITSAGTSKNTPEQKLLMLRNALEIAKTPTQKRTILQQIGRTGTFLGLLTAGGYLDDSNNDVQQAAVLAVQTIALAHPEYYGTEITALLNRAMAVNKDPEADYQKQAIQQHLAETPQEGGFVSMFNGRDLTGWKGLVENPIKRAAMTPKELAEKQVKADEIMRRDWKVVDGLLVFEGSGYDNLCSEKDYADFEMYVDWRITDKGDAGIYLRGTPQVQIWDIRNRNAHVGSGGLYNNQKHLSHPLLVADNPPNEWNSFYIKMIGEKVIVYLNGQLVVDNVTLENFWERSLPIFEKDAIELQAHGDRVEYRNIYVREISRPEPYKVSEAEKAEGFVPMFNGIDMSGWVGNLKDYIPVDGTIVCDPSLGGTGNLYTDKEYSNFVMRFDFLLTPAANNGIGIRAPLNGDAAYGGMEIQVLDNEAEVYRELQPYQYHGSVYGVIPAKRGFLKPVGEWNTEEIVADGNRIKVTVNGTVILDGDIAEASKNFTETIDKQRHPGLSNKSGHIGFLGHGSWVAFRNLRIKAL